jgi:hypothetical protein
MKIKGNYIKNRKMDLLSFVFTYDAKRIFKLIPKMNRQLIITSLRNIIILRRKYGKQLFVKEYHGYGDLPQPPTPPPLLNPAPYSYGLQKSDAFRINNAKCTSEGYKNMSLKRLINLSASNVSDETFVMKYSGSVLSDRWIAHTHKKDYIIADI